MTDYKLTVAFKCEFEKGVITEQYSTNDIVSATRFFQMVCKQPHTIDAVIYVNINNKLKIIDSYAR